MIKQLIKKNKKKLEKSVKENDKSLTAKIYIQFLSLLRPVYFNNEFLLLNGLKKKITNAPQSIIFFTVHKSASTFIKNSIIGLVNGKLIPVNLPGYLPPKKHKLYFNDTKKMEKVLLEQGFFYGAFRDYYNFSNLDKFKVLLVLRDPRDVLTSMYFTVLYNHPIGRKEVIDKRKEFEKFTIDEFVLDQAYEFKKKYGAYSKYLLNRSNVLFLKYEDMITDFPAWLSRLSDFLEVDNPDYIDNLIKKTSFKVKKEDKNSFIRNIQSGDHKNKLQPETIGKLNEIFKDDLIEMGYAL